MQIFLNVQNVGMNHFYKIETKRESEMKKLS